MYMTWYAVVFHYHSDDQNVMLLAHCGVKSGPGVNSCQRRLQTRSKMQEGSKKQNENCRLRVEGRPSNKCINCHLDF